MLPRRMISGQRHRERHLKCWSSLIRNAINVLASVCHAEQSRHHHFLDHLIANANEPRRALIACMSKLIIILKTLLAG